MKTFDFIQMTISHNLKDRILKLWNPTASLPFLLLRHSLIEERSIEGWEQFLGPLNAWQGLIVDN